MSGSHHEIDQLDSSRSFVAGRATEHAMVRSRWLYVAVLAVVLMVLLILFATPFGLGVSPDSTQYLATARNLLAGRGLMTVWWSGHPEPLSHFPPAYPLLLAAAGEVGVDPADAARWIHVILLPMSALLVGWMASSIAGGSSARRASTVSLAMSAIAVSPALATAHGMVWSEPLFITLLLGSLIMLAKSVEKFAVGSPRAGFTTLILAGALTGVATVTRYAGIVLVGSGVLVLMLTSDDSVATRIRRAALFGALAMTPIVAWVSYNHSRGVNGTNRALAVHVISGADLIVGVKTVAGFLVPFVPWWPVRIAALAGIGISAIVIVTALVLTGAHALSSEIGFSLGDSTDRRAVTSRVLVVESVVFLIAYPFFLIVSISLLDRSTQLDSRILLPMLPVAIALVVGIAARLTRRNRSPAMAAGRVLDLAITCLAVSYFAIQICGTLVWVASARRDGLGLEALGRENPAIFRRVRELPNEVSIYSNMPDAIYQVTGRVVRGLPYKYSPTSLIPNRSFAAEFRAIADSSARPEYVVVLDARTDTPFVPDERDVEAWLPIEHIDSLAGGRIIVLRRQSGLSNMGRSGRIPSTAPRPDQSSE